MSSAALNPLEGFKLTNRTKIVIVGSPKVGKSTLANFIAGISKAFMQSDYIPTVGARILEFERRVTVGEPKTRFQTGEKTVLIELWDVSGDGKYENTWPAMYTSADGVIILYNPDAKNQEKEISNWHTRFVATQNLKDSHVLIFAHDTSGSEGAAKPKLKLPKALQRIPLVNTSLENDPEAIKNEFDALLVRIAKDELEKREDEEDSIMNE